LVERTSGEERDPDGLGPARVAELDRADMLGALSDLSRQFVAGYAAARRALAGDAPAALARPGGVVVCGMGGSAIGAELVLACVPRLEAPALVVRGDELPSWAGPDTLVIGVSYSGETQETLACVEQALTRGCRTVCVASGGRLAARGRERGLPVVPVAPDLQPRAALGALATPVAAALVAAGLSGDLEEDVAEAAGVLRERASDLAPEVPEEVNIAKRLARRLVDRLVVVYGAGLTAPAARRWKTQVNENAGAIAFWGELPEVDHNEIEGWARPATLSSAAHVLLLEDEGWPETMARRAALTAEAVAGHGVPVERLSTHGLRPLARACSLIGIGDWTSFYLALSYGVDPSPVAAIARFKRRLAGGD
jgi:glucose/mannose-6-phosphate isomerase